MLLRQLQMCLILAVYTGCADHILNHEVGYQPVVVDDPEYQSDIRPIFQRHCFHCHMDGASKGNFSLALGTNAIVDVASAQAPLSLITPGSLADSYLWLKVNGGYLEVGGEGVPMPVGTPLDGAELQTLQNWIEDGAPGGLTEVPAAPTHDAHLQPLWEDRCTGCHLRGSSQGGLTLDSGFDALVNQTAIQSNLSLVEPGDPDQSYLLLKLRNEHVQAGGSGDSMPPNEPLTEIEIATVERWIEQGAQQ